jgi:O-antigen ligase
MNPDSLKLLGPLLILGLWLIFALRERELLVVGSALFFASYAGLSSNFNFIYRELHQVIQLVIIGIFIYDVVRKNRLHGVNRFIGCFLAFVFISLINAPFDRDASSQLINIIASMCVVNFLFLASRDRQKLASFVSFLAMLAVLLAFLGLLEFSGGGIYRVEATFSNPNYYGLFLGVGSCIILSTWRGNKKGFAFLLVAIAIVLSGSRSAITFPIMQILWSVYQSGRFVRAIPAVFILSLAALVVLTYGSTRYTNVERLDSSDAERVLFSKAALRMAIDNPITGVGWGRFISEYGNYSTVAERNYSMRVFREASERRRRVTHNDFLRILAELGWVAFAFSLVCAAWGLIIIKKNNSFGFDYLLPTYFGMLLYSVGHNNMNNAFFWFFFLLPFFLNLQEGGGIRRLKRNGGSLVTQ